MIPTKSIGSVVRSCRRLLAQEQHEADKLSCCKVIRIRVLSNVDTERYRQVAKFNTWLQRNGGNLLSCGCLGEIPPNVVIPRKYVVVNVDIPTFSDRRISTGLEAYCRGVK
jgi:hypothetical protein